MCVGGGGGGINDQWVLGTHAMTPHDINVLNAVCYIILSSCSSVTHHNANYLYENQSNNAAILPSNEYNS